MRYKEFLNEAEGDLASKLKSVYGDQRISSNVDVQVYEHDGVVTLSWEITFRRKSHVGAFKHFTRDVDAGNHMIRDVAKRYPGALIKLSTLDEKAARQLDSDADQNSSGGEDYDRNEYEQEIGGRVTLRNCSLAQALAPKQKAVVAVAEPKAVDHDAVAQFMNQLLAVDAPGITVQAGGEGFNVQQNGTLLGTVPSYGQVPGMLQVKGILKPRKAKEIAVATQNFIGK